MFVFLKHIYFIVKDTQSSRRMYMDVKADRFCTCGQSMDLVSCHKCNSVIYVRTHFTDTMQVWIWQIHLDYSQIPLILEFVTISL